MALLLTLVLLLGNAFFVGAEFALIASRRTVLELRAERSRPARIALSAMGQIPLMIAGAQLGITICSLGLGAVTEPAFAGLLERPFVALGLDKHVVHPVAFVLALGMVVYLHTVIGEMVPKNLTIAGPERAVVWLGPPMLAFCLATRPLLVAMKWLSRTILGLWGIEAQDSVKTVYTADELAGLVAESRTVGLLDEEEHARITGALALSRRTAQEAMRPWESVSTVTEDITPVALEVLATQTRRSRFPVVERSSRRVLGFVHLKDVLDMTAEDRRKPISPALIRPLAVVPPERTLAELLLFMRRGRHHIALVGSGGRPLGIVTLDDVLNAVVGSEPSPVAAGGGRG